MPKRSDIDSVLIIGAGDAGLKMAAGLVAALEVAPWKLPAEGVVREAFPSTQSIGNALLGRYVLPFEVASIVLLSVLVGAVVLSRKEVAEPRVSDDA